MKKYMILAAVASTLAGGAAWAQTPDADVAGHPRINEVDQRLENQQQRIDAGVKNGTINAKQEMRDEKRDAKVEEQLSKDEAKHHGHITKREQRKLNKELNHNSKDIKKQEEKH